MSGLRSGEPGPVTTGGTPGDAIGSRGWMPRGGTYLDPTPEREPAGRPLAEPLPAGEGARIALVDIRKPRGDVFLDELERLLVERGHSVERTMKPTFTKPAPADVRREIAERCDAVIEALAD